jgi:hypothetical protein
MWKIYIYGDFTNNENYKAGTAVGSLSFFNTDDKRWDYKESISVLNTKSPNGFFYEITGARDDANHSAYAGYENNEQLEIKLQGREDIQGIDITNLKIWVDIKTENGYGCNQ